MPLPPLLAKADVKKGEEDAKICETCHNFKEGAGAKIGPDLWNVVGRRIASFPGFAYSDWLKKIGGDWTYEKLNKWITDPKAMAAGPRWPSPGKKTRRSGPISWTICTRSPTSRFRSRNSSGTRSEGPARGAGQSAREIVPAKIRVTH